MVIGDVNNNEEDVGSQAINGESIMDTDNGNIQSTGVEGEDTQVDTDMDSGDDTQTTQVMDDDNGDVEVTLAPPTGKPSYARKPEYNKPNRVYHGLDGGKFKCNGCPKEFNSARAAHAHHVCIHVKEFKYLCQQCDKKYNIKTQWELYQDTHRNEKAHKCPKCGKGFNCKGNMNRHKKGCL